MRNRWLVLVGFTLAYVAIALSRGVAGTPYYFSDCATGGGGTIDNPYCLDVDGSGAGAGNGNEFINYLFDGIGTPGGSPNEAAPGDTIYLCCGGTGGCQDAASSCTYAVTPQGGDVFRPDLDATGNPVTIASYGGDVPTFTGDLDGDAVNDNGDATYLIHLTGGTRSGYHFVGPMVWKRGATTIFSAVSPNADISFDGVTFQEANWRMWGNTTGVGDGPPGNCQGGVSPGASCNLDSQCPGNGSTIPAGYCKGCYSDAAGGFLIYDDSSIGDFTFKNGTLSASCGMAIRHILGAAAGVDAGTWTIENVEAFNGAQFTNDWGNWDWRRDVGQRTVYRGNHVWDFQNGISIEDRNRYVTIEDNVFECRGVYDVSADGYGKLCAAQGPYISVTGGDDPNGCPAEARSGTNADITIRRNMLKGSRYIGDSSSASGWLGGGIAIKDGCRDQNACSGPGTPWWCCTGLHTWSCNQGSQDLAGCANGAVVYGCLLSDPHANVVENNMVWKTASIFSGRQVDRMALIVDTNVPTTTQNNTLYLNRYALEVRDGHTPVSPTVPTAHVVRDNLVASSSDVECVLASGSGATFDHNACSSLVAGHTVFQQGATTKAAFCSSWGDGNNCAGPNFVDVLSTDAIRWNLRLRYPDPGIIGAASGAGALDDIDKTTRPLKGSYDIGADECPFSAIDLDQQPAPGPVAPVVIRGKVRAGG